MNRFRSAHRILCALIQGAGPRLTDDGLPPVMIDNFARKALELADALFNLSRPVVNGPAPEGFQSITIDPLEDDPATIPVADRLRRAQAMHDVTPEPEPEAPWYEGTRYAEFWPTVDEDVVAIATDSNGNVCAYVRVPRATEDFGGQWLGGFCDTLHLPDVDSPCADWRESLELRPGTPE